MLSALPAASSLQQLLQLQSLQPPDFALRTDSPQSTPLISSERTRICLRICTLAAHSLQHVLAAHVPSDAIPLDAVDQPAQTAVEFIAQIPAENLPPDPSQAQQIRDLSLDLQRIINLHKFDVSTVDPAVHGYFRIDTGDAEPH